jgi:hypothetical protein
VIKLVRAVQTSIAMPSQWDAWDADGKYYYLRFRHGVGSIRHYPGGAGWDRRDTEETPEHIASFEVDNEWAGHIQLEEFAQKAGIELADDIEQTSYNMYLAGQLAQTLKETYPEEWAARYGTEAQP